MAKAESAALKAGVSVRRFRALVTLSERTLVEEDFSTADVGVVLIMVEWYVVNQWSSDKVS